LLSEGAGTTAIKIEVRKKEGGDKTVGDWSLVGSKNWGNQLNNRKEERGRYGGLFRQSFFQTVQIFGEKWGLEKKETRGKTSISITRLQNGRKRG